jgi:flagellar FliL protein
MSDDAAPEGQEAAAPKGGKKKLLIIVAAAVLLLGGGGGAGAYFMGFLGGGSGQETAEAGGHGEHAASSDEAPVFHEMPEMVVRLEGGQGPYLKLAAVLDLSSADYVEPIKAIEPRLVDMLQLYLMELAPADIKDTAGLHRVREELLRRVNDLSPHSTRAVLFKTIILQ